MVRINLKGKDISIDDSLREYAEKRLSGIDRLIENPELFHMELELTRTTRHHRKGPEVFCAKVNLRLPGKNFLRAESCSPDLYAAIDDLKEKLEKEFKRRKGKRRSRFERSTRAIKKIIHLSSLLTDRFKRKR